ncbi:MAG: CinA family nicotinamide mononucleotide deamidase-related protein [Spirochaetales bacterium]|nr:CinA family nicotinamide mononucleotide deamidase-related protein [Spirochaetales bacterium]MCF7937042.1 CinA family nicotinamide mononucleotide deamidase-related protein [Spirochaetales bacterium]
MNNQIQASFLGIGNEITAGTIQDKHGQFVGKGLDGLGIRMERILLVPDDAELLHREFQHLLSSDILITSGGLGPTSDDLTREFIAEAAGVELEFYPEIWEKLLNRFPGRKISDTNRKQAFIPAGFTIMPNANGTAPGFWGWAGDTLIAALPGPTGELRPMFEDQLMQVLRREFPLEIAEVSEFSLFQVSESALEESLLDASKKTDVYWSTRAHVGSIMLQLRGPEQERERVFRTLLSEYGPLRIRPGEVDPAQEIVKLLNERGERLVLAESCTGGLVAAAITEIPGSSEVFWGAVVSYDNDAKNKLLGVGEDILGKYGAVSAETVEAMACRALELGDSDYAAAVSGIAGPSGGSEEKPVGTVWIGLASRKGARFSDHIMMPGNRTGIRRRTVVAVLLRIEQLILGVDA